MYLDSYGKNQKIYNAFSNMWDCCSEFGELSEDDADNNDGTDNDFPMMPPPLAAAEELALGPDTLLANPLLTSSQPTPAVEDRSFTVARSAKIAFEWHKFETSKLLYDFYGFVPPLPLPAWPSSISKEDCDLLSTIIRLCQNDAEFFASSVASFAVEFIQSFKSSKTPKNAS